MLVRDMDPDTVPDPSGRADKAIRFMQTLTLWEGVHAGQRLRLQPYQEYILRRIYGPCRDDGSRAVSTACIWIPRGNGKTALAAGLALAHLCGPFGEPGGQVVLAAADRTNASIAYRHAVRYVEEHDRLRPAVRIRESRKSIAHVASHSSLVAVSSDAYNKHGMACHAAVLDEIHAWMPTKARKLYDAITDSMRKRPNPLTIIISTAGDDTGGLAWELWRYSQEIEEGTRVDPSFCSVRLALPLDYPEPWNSPKAWHAVNPAFSQGGFLNEERIADKARWAEASPSNQSAFKRFTLNQWEEGSEDPWVDMQRYDEAPPRRSLEELEGQPCWMGVDLSSVNDLTAVTTVFRTDSPDGQPVWDVLSHAFLPEDGLARKADKDRAPYLEWIEQGYMTATPGDTVDYREIEAYIVRMCELYRVDEIAYDRWNSSALVTWLMDRDLPVVAVGQGYVSMSSPVREMEAAILDHRFRHGGNPVLRMCISHVSVMIDPAENKKFTKSRTKIFGRIDCAVACAMAMRRALTRPDDQDNWDLGPIVV